MQVTLFSITLMSTAIEPYVHPIMQVVSQLSVLSVEHSHFGQRQWIIGRSKTIHNAGHRQKRHARISHDRSAKLRLLSTQLIEWTNFQRILIIRICTRGIKSQRAIAKLRFEFRGSSRTQSKLNSFMQTALRLTINTIMYEAITIVDLRVTHLVSFANLFMNLWLILNHSAYSDIEEVN